MARITIKALTAAVGGLSKPSKMPGYSYGIPAERCKIGSLLRRVKGSTCSKCYALKGMYVFPVVQAAQERRYQILMADLEAWTSNMTELIGRKLAKREKVFRWHDSGDIQSMEHLSAIVTIAKNLPDVRFWLPTRELGIVSKWIAIFGNLPTNLVVRLSGAMIGKKATKVGNLSTSTVDANKGHGCIAYQQGGACGDCRACWDPTIENIDYPKH